MPLPIPNLDDRRFDDLVADARERLHTHLPELTQIAPGDPMYALVDVFAYLTETMLFRANLIPERQRRMVMNLLQIPQRNAIPARGVVCLDAGTKQVTLAPLVTEGAQFKAGTLTFTGLGEIQPTPFALNVSIKQRLPEGALSAMGLSHQSLREQYGLKMSDIPEAFEPRSFALGQENPSLVDSLDRRFYLALTLPKGLRSQRQTVRDNYAGTLLNLAIAPADDAEGEEINQLPPRRLVWEFLSRDEAGHLLNLPLEVVHDSSLGGRQMGVIRLRLPANAALFDDFAIEDPMFAGVGEMPPELSPPLSSELVVGWLRLSCPEEPELTLGYLGVNGLDVVGQGLKQDVMLGVGTGNPDQVVRLPDAQIEAKSLVLQVEEDNAWVTWSAEELLVGHGGEARVFRLDATEGVVYFGDGLEGGRRPPKGKRIRAASYLFGGGTQGNVPAGEIKETSAGSRLVVRQQWPTKGGVDAETLVQAERRIPQYLTHRNRAVTAQDYQILIQNNPVAPVARAEVLEGFIPGSNIQAARFDVPGVVSTFVIPPRYPALRQTPKPTRGMLKDVFNYLLQRVLVGTELYVLSPEYVQVAIGVNVRVLDPLTEQQTTQAVQTALVNYLWPLAPGGATGNGWGMGVAVSSNELQTQVSRVDGVRAVKAFSLFYKAEGGWQRLPQGIELPLLLYQLPELMGVSVGTGDGEPDFPSGIEAEDAGSNRVPAPIIPEVC